jgi:hypothetical protein
MSAIIQVKNFERFQHYKHRNPPWIKFYNDLLDNYEFAGLPDASKAHLLAIWLLASRYNNEIPADPQWIARRINANEPVNLELLKELGFVVEIQRRSKLLAKRKQNALPETETETETEREIEKETPLRGVKKSRSPNGSRGGQVEVFGRRLPEKWEPSPEDRVFAASLLLDVDAVLGEFRDYWKGVPGARGRKLDWSATFRNRCREVAGRRTNGLTTRPKLDFSRI